ncbi:MetQ/NlpA family ABC transporter substrate-binding protein [Pseudomonas aeruginosa]
MQKAGLLKLKDLNNALATKDIAENPKNPEVWGTRIGPVATSVLDQVDLDLINTNYALAPAQARPRTRWS